MSSNSAASEAREASETIYEISKLLNTGLDKETLAIAINLIDNGVNPEALADVILDLRSKNKQTNKKKEKKPLNDEERDFRY